VASPKIALFTYGDFCEIALLTMRQLDAIVCGLVVAENRPPSEWDIALQAASKYEVPILMQPRAGRLASFLPELAAWQPDLILIWSYSLILTDAIISIPAQGVYNIHGGLLPEYRGPHVMQWAIINGEPFTGVTLHKVDVGIDTGPIIGESRFPIEPDDDAGTVHLKLIHAGRDVLATHWDAVEKGCCQLQPQDGSRACYYPKIRPDDGIIDWYQPCEKIRNRIRAFVKPWWGAFTFWHQNKIKVWASACPSGVSSGAEPGTILGQENGGLRVATGSGDILLLSYEWDVGATSTGDGVPHGRFDAFKGI